MNFSFNGPGLRDLLNGLKNLGLSVYLARSDIKRRYRRSTLGPFWITLSTAIMIGCIGLIFGNLFKSDISEFLPFIAAGLITWTFISTVINESSSVFPMAESVIRQLPLPLFTHVEQMIFKNLFIFFHNIIIFPVVCVIVHHQISLKILFVIPGLLILILNLCWLSLLIGIICTRFRDMAQIISSLLQIAFYVTPIIWMPSLLIKKNRVMFLDFNPFYHLLELVRAPLLNTMPSPQNCLSSLGLLFIGWTFTLLVYNRYKNSIAYWL